MATPHLYSQCVDSQILFLAFGPLKAQLEFCHFQIKFFVD